MLSVLEVLCVLNVLCVLIVLNVLDVLDVLCALDTLSVLDVLNVLYKDASSVRWALLHLVSEGTFKMFQLNSSSLLYFFLTTVLPYYRKRQIWRRCQRRRLTGQRFRRQHSASTTGRGSRCS